MVFDNKRNGEHYCDNCMYHHTKVGQVSNFEEYNISAKLGMIYTCIIEYSDLLLSNEC